MTKATSSADTTDKIGNHPTLILIRGLPGSGKSYLAAALQESLGKEEVVIIDPDKIDKTSEAYIEMSKSLTEQGVDEKFHPYRFLRAKAYDAILAQQIIIWNQAFTNLDSFNKMVVSLQAYAAEHGTQLPVLVVEVEVSESTAKSRVAAREAQGGHGVSENSFARFIGDYASFADKGYGVVVVSGENDVAVSVASVMEKVHELDKE